MASFTVGEASSSSPCSSSSTPRLCTYHVFLSFGDKRKGFVDHLYDALERKGITTFKDDKDLERGQVISKERLKAIQESMFAITILSPDYASSTWCLDELQKIMECNSKMDLEVLPVFYGVDPSDVRHKKRRYEEAFRKHQEKFGQHSDRVERWRDALTQVAGYSGWDSKDQHEAALVESIAQHIHKKLVPKLPSWTENLVGIASKVKDVSKLIGMGLNDVRFIGIWGMGGIGKTTIARAVYEAIQGQFEVTCFLANVREVFVTNGLVYIQRELLSQPSICRSDFYNLYDGINTIRSSLCSKKVLLVLDDVNEVKQLENLAGKQDWFGPGSRVIITTRDMRLLMTHGVPLTYEVSSDNLFQERIYDVFLSYRGEDSRTKFTSHLYAALQNAGFYIFKDDDEIQRGDQISVSLLKAIRMSRISIVVLSKNYANSKWCMLELENIMEIGRTRGLVVVPVFYEVDPSEVRNQTGKFGEAFEALISRISDDERKRNWEKALLEVGGIAGVVVINSRNESEDIRKVVDRVTNLLDMSDLFVADHPVGVESRVQDVIQLLNNQQSEAPLMLGIWGMGGIGKTTIAKAAYNEIRRDFEAKSFLLNVREVWEQDNGKVSLQQKVLSDIYKTTKIKIDSIESGKNILKERLSQKTMLLVLDDVNKLDQLNALCGSRKWFGQGSRIIITTRDDDLLSRLKVEHVYRMKEMDDNESLELFSWHAFKQESPYEGFADFSRDVVKYSGGLPLALQVIGSFLLTRRRKTEWKSVLEKLKLIPNDEVLEKLRISFDGLRDDDMKEIFLDIAFFFIGMDQEDVTKILKECGHYAEIGISVLVQQSLVTVDWKNKIGMHDLLRDMGREIVRKKSTEGGKEPSRLWRYEDVQYLLSKDARTIDVKGLTLKMSRMDSTTNLETKAFEKMDKLRLLQLAGVQLDGNYKYLSRDLKWLCWHGFPLKYTPADFHQGSLVAIDLKYSNLQRVWKKSQLLEKLKILNLSHSHNLRQTPDFSYLPNLEKLILKDCPSLSSVSSNIGDLNKILLINLEDCTGLRELPRSIYKLESLKTLVVSGCTKIDKLEEDIEQMKSLTTLVADKTPITKVPFAVVRSKSIVYISLCGFKGFSRNVFPSIIQSWMSPTNNILYQVQTSVGTSSVDLLDEQNGCFYGLPSILEDLQNLPIWLKCDSQAQLNQILASILDNLHPTSCEELEAMQNTPQNSNIVASVSIDCRSQVRISSSKNSLTSLLIQMGMNCHATDILRENILQNMPPIGFGLLPGDNYPDWLTFNCNDSSVTFEVPQVDGRDLKTIICIVHSSSPYNITSGGLKVVLVINCTKNTILLYKRDALLASSDEEEWQRVVSNTEPGDKVKVIVGFVNGFEVIKTTVYLIYDEPIDKKTNDCHEPNKNVIVSGDDENIFGRLLFRLPSLVRAILISRPFSFCLVVIMVWWSRCRSDKRRRLFEECFQRRWYRTAACYILVIAKLDGPAVSQYCALRLLQVRFLLRSGREYDQASADSDKLSPRFLGYFLFHSSEQKQSLDKSTSFKEQSAHVTSVKNILENHASYLMAGKELSKLVAFVKGTQFDLVEYLQRERYGSARLENFASGLELISQKLQMGTLQSRLLDADFLLAHMCSVKFKEWIVVLATLLRRSEVLFDLFRHDFGLWKAYSMTLQSHLAFTEYQDLLEDLEEKLSSVANVE